MLNEFDELVKQRGWLKSWWSLGSTHVGYGDGKHELRVDCNRPSLLTFCGQSYAGAKNYHDAPGFFVEAFQKEMQAESKRIASQAYEKELSRLDAAIEKHRASVLEQLESA